MTTKIEAIKQEINDGDLSFEDIAVLFDVTVRQVDIVWLDMINTSNRAKDQPLFVLD